MSYSSNEGDLFQVGRHGKLRLIFREKDGQTLLADSYATMPMHFLPPLYPDDSGWAYACLVNPTGGFVGGDKIEIDITLRKKSHLFLTSQSATRIYKSTGASATQEVNINVGEKAAVEYLPGYVIPFAGSLYRQTTAIRMEKNASALIAESFTTGRLAMDEHLLFEEFTSSMNIEYDGTPVVFDSFKLRPGGMDYEAFGLLESFRICSTIYLVFSDDEKKKALLDSLLAVIDKSDGILGGVSELWTAGIVIRLLGMGARYIEKAETRIWSIARKAISPNLVETDGSVSLHSRLAGLGS